MEAPGGGFEEASSLDVLDDNAVVNTDQSFLLKPRLDDELDLARPDFARGNRAALKRYIGRRRDAVGFGRVNRGNKRSERNQEIGPIDGGCCRAIFHRPADSRELRVGVVGREYLLTPVVRGAAVVLGPSDYFASGGGCSHGSQMEH